MTKRFAMVFLFFNLFAVGCGAADAIKDKFTCNDVCKSYASCFDANYDVDSCTSKCESEATDSDAKQNMLNACHDCIDGKSCVSDIASCSADCSAFVP